MTVAMVFRKWLQDNGITQGEMAVIMGVSRYTVNQLANGKRNVTAVMALRLASATGTGPEAWMDLQRDADLAAARKAMVDGFVDTVRPVGAKCGCTEDELVALGDGLAP